ncbi:MAG: glycosyltransferase [Acidimicrobiia bacterium]
MLVVIKGLGIGGAERLIAAGARFWDRNRFDYRVAYALPWKDQLVPDLRALGIPVQCFGSRRGLDPAAVGRLRSLIRRSSPALVHAHLPAVGVLTRLVSPAPVIYTEHNLVESYRYPTRLANRLTYRRNRAVIAVSEAVAHSISSYPGPAPVVVANGVDCTVSRTELQAARQELGLSEDALLVVHVGNIRPHKGHRTLVAATAVLRQAFPNVTVVSIGGEKSSGDLDRLRKETQQAGLNGALRFLGRRDDALSFVAAADVFVNPADVEGLPVAVLEAMALERPVVATAVGGVPAVIADGTTGLLVEPGDPRALAAGMARLLRDRPLATRLGRNARALVERDYGLEPMVRAVEAIYAAVLDA